MKADKDSSGWGRKLMSTVSITPLAEPSSNNGWGRKNPPEETNSSPSEPMEDPDALRESQYLTGVVLPHYDRRKNYVGTSKSPETHAK